MPKHVSLSRRKQQAPPSIDEFRKQRKKRQKEKKAKQKSVTDDVKLPASLDEPSTAKSIDVSESQTPAASTIGKRKRKTESIEPVESDSFSDGAFHVKRMYCVCNKLFDLFSRNR